MAALDALRDTKHDIASKDRDLPAKANCITATRYLLKTMGKVHLPRMWIGDLPYALSLLGWQVMRVEQLQPGDLLFRGYKKGVITHVAVALIEGKVYHCARRNNSVVESADQFLKLDFSGYETPGALLKNRDVRRYSINKK